jgi:hypothetical protein
MALIPVAVVGLQAALRMLPGAALTVEFVFGLGEETKK